MKLLTKALEARFAEVGEQDVEDPIVIAKFFTPWAGWTWYATAYYPGNGIFFGLVKGIETELGEFSLKELEGVKGPCGMRIERDLNFSEKKLSEVSR